MIFIDLFVEVVGYTTARIIVPLLSFGKLCVQPMKSNKTGFNAVGLRPDGFGKIEIEQTTAAWIGNLFWIALAIIIFALA